jgi:ADP-ribosyl-[dinitrogen reductase] hydrolase
MSNDDVLARLVECGRIPQAVQRAVPVELPPCPHVDQLQDRFRGTMLGVAIGDALGRAGEGHPFEATAQYHGGPLRAYRPWRGWKAGPVGTVTDDTQMTMCIAESIVHNGQLVPEDVADRFAEWLDYGRGKGRTCVEACERLRRVVHWTAAGVDSAGNGAAMRTAPIGLFHRGDLKKLRRDAALACVITHTHQTAVASAIAQSAAVAYCLTQDATGFSPDRFIEFVVAWIEGVEEADVAERRPGAALTTLAKRLAELPGLLGEPDTRAVYDYLYNGAFVLESLPTAMFAFLRNYQNFDETLFAAVDAGYDCDTSGSMAGALAGALLGQAGIHARWLEELEYREELIRLADGLHQKAGG